MTPACGRRWGAKGIKKGVDGRAELDDNHYYTNLYSVFYRHPMPLNVAYT